eukprot:gene10432-8382_t
MFQYWKKMAPAMPRGERLHRALNLSDEILMQEGIKCKTSHIQVFRYHAENRTFTASLFYQQDFEFSKARAYLNFLDDIFSQPQYADFLAQDFAFYFEAMPGFQVSPKSSELQLPLLVNSRTAVPNIDDVSLPGFQVSPNSIELQLPLLVNSRTAVPNIDDVSLPAPDHHAVMGYEWMLRGESSRGDKHRIYSYDFYPPIPWKERINWLIARGPNRKVLNPFELYEGELVGTERKPLLLRNLTNQALESSLLKNLNGETYPNTPSVCYSSNPSQGCRGGFSPDEMMQYRYLPLVDSDTVDWDDTVWMLASGSTVFYALPVNSTDSKLWKPWELWYSPLLRPYVHYIPCSIETIMESMEACQKLGNMCASVGAASRQLMLNSVNMKSAMHYTALLIKHVHDAFSE